MTRVLCVSCFIFFLRATPVFAQIFDDFSDGDFTSNPSWSGKLTHFMVNGAFELQTNGPSQSDTAWLSVPIAPDYGDTIQWIIDWRMAFSPSANNAGRVYLVSTHEKLHNNASPAYYLQIGNSGNDTLRFYRYTGNQSVLLAMGETDYSTNPNLRLRVTRYPDHTWVVESDPGMMGAFVTEMSVQDSAFIANGRMGVWCKYTSSNATKFYFDNVSVSYTPFYDTVAPQLNGAQPLTSTTLKVQFSEPVDSSSALSIGNYAVSGGVGQPLSAAMADPSNQTVSLAFANPFPVDQPLVLTATGIADTAGNVMSMGQVTFKYLEFKTPGQGDIIINEIMADPSPPVGLPEVEYIEILNPTDSFVALDSLRFSDAATTGQVLSNNRLYLRPGELAIISASKDTASLSVFGKVFASVPWPALNNSGDDLQLDLGMIKMDRVSYSTGWYSDPEKAQGGYSLERINPYLPCSGSANWSASNASAGGTPGTQNSVFSSLPDSVPPIIIGVSVVSTNEFVVSFSESLDSNQVSTLSVKTNPTLSINGLSTFNEFTQLSVSVAETIDSSTLYTVVISGATDCSGNIRSMDSAYFGIGTDPKPYEVIINEIYPIPAEAGPFPAAEFVELYNRTNKLIRVENISISDASTTSKLTGGLLLPNEYVVVCDDGLAGLWPPAIKVIATSSMPSLNNSGDVIALHTPTREIDRVDYDDRASEGISLERIDPYAPCAGMDNWAPCTDVNGATPGNTNSNHLPGSISTSLKITSIVPLSLREIAVEFSQSLSIDPDQPPSAKVNDDPALVQPNPENRQRIEVWLNAPMKPGAEYTMEVSGIKNCEKQSSALLKKTYYLADSGDVVINEILFNPRGNGADFIELINISQHTITLDDWSLGYYDSKDSLRQLFLPSGISMKTGQIIAFSEDPENIKSEYPSNEPRQIVKADLPSYPNSSGVAMVYGPLKTRMDLFEYDEDMHFDLITSTDGVSLERLDPARPTNDAGNWHSASATSGYATPGLPNSQFYTSEVPDSRFQLSNTHISPDNDGYQDVVLINYSMPEPGWVATVTVFDRQGIPVATVAQNQLLGATGSITWDGIVNHSDKATPGIYVILVEAFDLQGNRFVEKLPIVVATRFGH